MLVAIAVALESFVMTTTLAMFISPANSCFADHTRHELLPCPSAG
jgi:hypothetical protein